MTLVREAQRVSFNIAISLKVMFKLCLYGGILIVSGGCNTKWSVVPVWRLGIRTHLKWAWVFKYYYILALARACNLCYNNYMEVTIPYELNIRIWNWKCEQPGLHFIYTDFISQ
jgi:hypothetical protein